MKDEIFKVQRPIGNDAHPYLIYNADRSKQALAEPTPELATFMGDSHKRFAFGELVSRATGRTLTAFDTASMKAFTRAEEEAVIFKISREAPAQAW